MLKSSKGYDVVSPCQVAQLYWKRTLVSVNFVNPTIQVSDENRFTGHTKQTIKNLFDDGDILLHQYPSFFKAAGEFMVTVVRYLLKCYPNDYSLLKHTNWIHFTSKFNHNFNCVEYFVGIFLILNGIDEDISQKLLSTLMKLGIAR